MAWPGRRAAGMKTDRQMQGPADLQTAGAGLAWSQKGSFQASA